MMLVLRPFESLRVAPSKVEGRRAQDERELFCTLVAMAVLLVAASASAQSTGTPATQGPMVVERVHSGFLAAPDVKVTEVDGTTSALAGGYAGWLSDETFFVGGGGYWLANP